ncbi:Methyltransferase domain-containing protein [Algoriphagus boritolerans DSM 17298 = JCM 18970]|uniref:Methyltransferase domain-containing protein n=1 Tax=Algoriphagus boritolerans DSM 17298 = JCM 18970 TaxID=1120964 RepID=A0A1H5WEV0_9BACT|nr:Methyltransferase domain-containing protein [Algoriphagus boritolerans DSM 17298 = JCM 18970]
MRDWFFLAKAYFGYWLKKEDRFSQQSPFVFDLYSGLIQFLKAKKKGNLELELFRNSLLKDYTKIEVLDLGAGSKKAPHSVRQVAEITRFSTSGIKFCQLYQFFCRLTPAEQVIELGTCVGISTRYLSKVTKGKLYTLEGSPEIQKVATRNPKPHHTEFILGPIHETLPTLLSQIPKVDFALIDANHTYEGTIFSFNSILKKAHPKTIIAIGDIHWTPEMDRAWKEIKTNPSVKLTFDFFECGIVLFEYPGGKVDLILDI